MSRFNTRATRPQVRSTVQTETISSGPTHQGGPGFDRADAKSELFLLAASNFAGENTFYESGLAQDNRLATLVKQVAVEDVTWLTNFLTWLRAEGNLRSVSISAAVYAVKARLEAGLTGGNRQLVNTVIQRADEPGEVLAAWTSRYGRAIPKPVKRGVEDAVQRLYNERSLLKYDSVNAGFRFGDVIELVHPSPALDKPWQSDLFKHALDRRHGRDETIPASLHLLLDRSYLMGLPVEQRRSLLLTNEDAPAVLRSAGMTWEALAGWLQGPMDKAAWEAIIPSMGYMALLRNLRNFDEAGVSDKIAETVAKKLSDPEEVAQSRQLPMRFLSAYKAAPSLRWAWALEQALNHSLSNVPVLKGRTLILVDRSGSMFGGLSEKSGLNRADTAAIFGSALALRADAADLVEFGSSSQSVTFTRSSSLLKMVEKFGDLGGTQTGEAVRRHYQGHDRVIVITDEQVGSSFYYRGDPFEALPPGTRTYTWNLVGYERGHAASGSNNRHTFGGLSDSSFKIIPLLEANRDGTWPWED